MTPASNAFGDVPAGLGRQVILCFDSRGDGVPELQQQLSTAQSATASDDLVLARGGRT